MKTLRVYEKEGAKTVTIEKGFNWWAFFFPGPWGLSKGLFLVGIFGLVLPVVAFFPVVDPVFVALIIPIMMIVYGAKGNDWMIARLEKEGYACTGDKMITNMSHTKHLPLSGILLVVLIFAVIVGGAPEYERYLDRQSYSTAYSSASSPPFGRNTTREVGDEEFETGAAYYEGEGVPKDDTEAFRWFKLAAEQGHIRAQVVVGTMYADGVGVRKDYAEAVRWYRRAAEQGHAEAQKNLGFVYSTGQGVSQDHHESVRWYKLAAAQGHAEAQFSLGVRYNQGLGVIQDYVEAVSWYRHAAKQGHASSQSNLGFMYIAGHGVPKDLVKAYYWCNLAAAQGDKTAVNNRSVVETQMTRSQIAEAQRLSSNFRPETETPPQPQ